MKKAILSKRYCSVCNHKRMWKKIRSNGDIRYRCAKCRELDIIEKNKNGSK